MEGVAHILHLYTCTCTFKKRKQLKNSVQVHVASQEGFTVLTDCDTSMTMQPQQQDQQTSQVPHPCQPPEAIH